MLRCHAPSQRRKAAAGTAIDRKRPHSPKISRDEQSQARGRSRSNSKENMSEASYAAVDGRALAVGLHRLV